jgi:adenine phosphoribosyltransferase
VDLASHIRDIPDFPKPGILFKDITTLLKDPGAFEAAVQQLAAPYREREIDLVVGVESRGFIFGAAVALELDVGFIPVRKPGKLPAETVAASYELEYGTDSVEMHRDAISPGQKVLLVDDLLATGGTMEATCRLVEELEGEVAGIAFLIELTFLDGRKKLGNREVFSVLKV